MSSMTETSESMRAYDEAQQMILNGAERDDIEMRLVTSHPELNARGLVPTIIRRAYKDLAEL